MKEDIVPHQEQGSNVDTDYTFHATSRNDALGAYLVAVQRLLDVNCWDKLCGTASARFEVTDAQGIPIDLPANEGSYFRIAIPGPGTVEGDGYDWVRVEMLEHQRDTKQDEEQVSMRVRPALNPASSDGGTAHFFDSQATSTFRVRRKALSVTASVHGRNETANSDTGNMLDTVRNAVVSLGARAGLSSLQWSSLVKGLIEGMPSEHS